MPENKPEKVDQPSDVEDAVTTAADRDELSEEDLDSTSGGAMAPPQRHARSSINPVFQAVQKMGIIMENKG